MYIFNCPNQFPIIISSKSSLCLFLLLHIPFSVQTKPFRLMSTLHKMAMVKVTNDIHVVNSSGHFHSYLT